MHCLPHTGPVYLSGRESRGMSRIRREWILIHRTSIFLFIDAPSLAFVGGRCHVTFCYFLVVR